MKLEELTALYSPLDIEYSQAMSGPYEDLSFRSDECTVIAGLKDGRISGFWRPVVAVGDDRSLKLHIERLFDICPNIYYMDFLVGGKLSVISQFLLRHGHKARPYYTQIIDLTKTEEELHADLRKSYKSLVNNGIVRPITINEAKSIHDGYSSRSLETWEIQKTMIGTQQAFLLGEGEVTYVLVYYNESSSYYASGRGGQGHRCLWKAIIIAKECGCENFELGEQVFSGDPKLVNISKFKRGFGGKTKTRLILERE